MPRKTAKPTDSTATASAGRLGVEAQPVTHVRWIPRAQLHSNSYNPNRVAPPELRLLKTSILKNGWTQPIVVREDFEIVDGFHRWTVSADPEIHAMTSGYVPVVVLSGIPMSEQIMATIRHNRARGQHLVLPMGAIVATLIDDEGMTPEEVQRDLQMEDEEVDRLYDTRGMPVRGGMAEFNKGWVPSTLKE